VNHENLIINYYDFPTTALKLTFRSEPVNQTVYVGESVVLKCSPPRGNPVPSITWLQHGSLVSNTSRTFISAKGNLTISPVTKADQGLYICRANSPLGTRDSHGASLTVKGRMMYILFFKCRIVEFHQKEVQLFTGCVVLFTGYI